MIISVEKRFVFVANTKTASTSIERVLMRYANLVHLGGPGRKHANLQHMIKKYDFLFAQPGYEPSTFVKFGVMREPLDWIGSWYRYRKGNKVKNPLPEDTDFEAFWARKDRIRFRDKARKLPNLQRNKFCKIKGDLLADVIIPFDRLGEVFPILADGLGLDVTLKHENKSRIPPAPVIPDHLLDEVRAFYEPDYELYNRLDEINAPVLEKLKEQSAQGAAEAPKASEPA